jgi:hypothetical protein
VKPAALRHLGGNIPKPPSGAGTWSVKVGSKLTPNEVSMLGTAGFKLKIETHMLPEALAQAANRPDAETVERTRFGRKVQRKTVVSKDATKVYAKYMEKNAQGQVFVARGAHLNRGTRFERVFDVYVGDLEETQEIYKVVIGKFPECDCEGFKLNRTKRGYQNCWHLYSVFALKVGAEQQMEPCST